MNAGTSKHLQWYCHPLTISTSRLSGVGQLLDHRNLVSLVRVLWLTLILSVTIQSSSVYSNVSHTSLERKKSASFLSQHSVHFVNPWDSHEDGPILKIYQLLLSQPILRKVTSQEIWGNQFENNKQTHKNKMKHYQASPSTGFTFCSPFSTCQCRHLCSFSPPHTSVRGGTTPT